MLLLLTVALTACQPETSEPPPSRPPPAPSAPACGNGVVEAGETCDGNCPTACNDGLACTTDVLTGSAATCDAACTSQPITACTGGDGCCAPGCNANNDSDCAPRCGNGVVEREEACDGNCPTQCNDNVACTTDVLAGSAATCDAVCSYQPVTACRGGDGCCAPGCNATTGSDCSASCGNGIVEPPESCDGSCPTSCDDGNACTADLLAGSAQACSAVCGHTPISACKGGDGCCAPGCNANNDSDCSATCGNNTVESGEKCDGNCPTSCNDGNVCTTDVLTGSAGSCNAACTSQPITTCRGGDGCCAPGCNANNDSDCAASCGNKVIEPGEKCDGNCPTSCNDGNACTTDVLTGSAQTCSAACTAQPLSVCKGGDGCCAPGCNANNDGDCSPVCGNSVVEPGEGCDGNCPTSCNDGEVCTTDVLTGAGSCNAACTSQPVTTCGGGDGCCAPGCNANNDSDCAASCGNGVVEGSEACDGNCPTACNDGNACTTDALLGSAAACSATCSAEPITACFGGDGCCAPGCNANTDSDCAPSCGNGIVEPTEMCDGNCPTTCNDGNSCTTDVRSGSAGSCNVTCTQTPITVCRNSDGCCAPGCNGSNDNNCPSVCGNAIVEPGEKCDGNCPTSCDDGNACTSDVVTGSANFCDAACTTQPVVACTSADGCCPTGCRRATDGDCPEPTQVSGEVCTTTWSGEVVVTGTVTVPAGCTLTIAAGTQVSFDVVDANSDGKGDVELVVEGTLMAQGDTAYPVVMMPSTGTQPGSWKGVRLLGTGSNLQGVTVQSAETGVRVEAGTHTLPRLKVLSASGHGVSVKSGAAAALTDCTLKDNGGAGAFSDGGRLDLSFCEVRGNAPGVYYRGNATGLLSRSKLIDNRSEGLSLWRSSGGGEPSVVINYNSFINNSTERAGLYGRRVLDVFTSREWACSCYEQETWTAPAGAWAHTLFVSYGEAQYFHEGISADLWAGNANVLHMETNYSGWLDISERQATQVTAGILDREANYIGSSAGMGVDVMYYGDATLGDTQVVAVMSKTGIDARNNYWNGALDLYELRPLFAMPANDAFTSDPYARTVDYQTYLWSPVGNAGPRP